MNILLVEDDLQLGKALCRGLEIAGFQPCWVRLLADSRVQLNQKAFDLMLLDLGLPDGDGQDELIALRKSGEKIPIIILTARTQIDLSLIHISEPTRPPVASRMPSSA